MKKLTFVVDERELSTIRAALYLLQEQVDALPEDLAEMIAEHGKPMSVSEIDHLSLCLGGATSPTAEHVQQAYSHLDCTVEVKRSLKALSLIAPPEPSIYTVSPRHKVTSL